MAVKCTISSDEQGRRTYLIPDEYSYEEGKRFETALLANVLTAKSEFHNRRVGANKYVMIFVEVPAGIRPEEIDGVIRGLAGRSLEFVRA